MFVRQLLHNITLSKLKQLSFLASSINRYYQLFNIKSLFNRYYHEGISPSHIMGINFLQNSSLNKGLGFTLEERQVLGIHGLQAPRIKTQSEQVETCKLFVDRYRDPVNKYLYLTDLHDRNERIFFRLLAENLEELMPIVYTPTVGQVCQKFGVMFRRPRGLFITSNDRGYIINVLRNWPEPKVRAIVVTDGERILGLGDLGANGMGIPVGKLALYTALGGIPPHQCLPIQLDCGTNNTKLLEDPLYIGLRQPRLYGKEYDDFIDEFMQAVAKHYGPNTLIQFEDFANKNAFKLLDKYRNSYCIFNDDIQGTGSVVLAGLYASKGLTDKDLIDHTILFVGAGEAAIGIASLCAAAIHVEGVSIEEARNKIYMADVDGLLTIDRIDKLDKHQKLFAKDREPITSLIEIIKEIKPSILIGASATKGLFTEEILQYMAKQNERPIVFALSNPTSKSECTAEEAYNYTNGQVVFSSGSPFPPVEYDGKTYKTGQGNNAYIYPGIALGIIATQSYHIPDEMFVIAAQELANSVCRVDLESGSLYPPLNNTPEVSLRIAIAISEYAYCHKYASVHPEPQYKRRWLQKQLYNFNYNSAIPVTWQWPPPPYIKTTPKSIQLHDLSSVANPNQK